MFKFDKNSSWFELFIDFKVSLGSFEKKAHANSVKRLSIIFFACITFIATYMAKS